MGHITWGRERERDFRIDIGEVSNYLPRTMTQGHD